MKFAQFVFTAILTVSTLALFGCRKDSSTPEDSDILYSKMLSYTKDCSTGVNAMLSSLKTKSIDGTSYEAPDFTIDLSRIDEKYLKYISIYTQPEDINDWDERTILGLVNADPGFSSEEKDIFAQSIAVAYFLKNEFSNVVVSTKADEEECRRAFYTAMKRATRNAALALAFGGASGGPVGVLAAAVYYYIAIDDAQEDYNRCIGQ